MRPSPRPRSHYRAFHRLGTRWGDNDAYGHVNNAVHYTLFDTAVNSWMIDAGLLDIGGDPIGLVVETGCRYFAALVYPQDIDVGLHIAKVGTSSIAWEIGIFAAGEDQPAAEGHFTHVVVDAKTHRPVAVPGDWREKLAALT